MQQRILAQIQLAVGVLRRAGVGGRDRAGRRSPAAFRELAVTRRAGQRHPARRGAGAGRGARLDDALLAEIAGWRDGSAPLAGPDRGHRSVVDAARRAGRARRAPATTRSTRPRRPTRPRPASAAPPRCARCGPTAENKAAVWERLIHDDGMANALQDAAIAGFSHPAQRDLLAPFTDQYFDDVAGVWERRSIEVAQKVAVGLFPRWAVADRTVELAIDFEAAGPPGRAAPAGVRGPRRHASGRCGPARPTPTAAPDAGGT